MKAVRRVVVTLCLVVATGAAGWYGWQEWDSHASEEATQDAYVRSEITVLSPGVSGYAIAISADDDEAVTAGQIVVRIDPRDYKAAVERAQATVDQAQATLDQSKVKLQLQTSTIEVAEAALLSADAQAKNAAVTFGRARDLLSHGAGTQATLDATTAADVSARSSTSQAQSQLALQRQQVGVLQADIRVAETRVADAQAALGVARIALQNTEVWSPVSWRTGAPELAST
jgi:membrane fusion protein (multidrug efflux system)